MEGRPSCHFLWDIKLVSANSHLLNFSFFTYEPSPQDFYDILKLHIRDCFLIWQARASFKIVKIR